jgi:hypothetical protein
MEFTDFKKVLFKEHKTDGDEDKKNFLNIHRGLIERCCSAARPSYRKTRRSSSPSHGGFSFFGGKNAVILEVCAE